MKRLGICAFGAFVITTSTAYAQSAPALELVLLGQDKAALPCPEYCAPQRITSLDQATVGEREVIATTMAAATGGAKLHIDHRRATLARIEKLPGPATFAEVPTVTTQNEFRPALDPVLAEPTTEPVE